MAQSKRILISGYYGFANAGDEAVLSALIEGLRAHGRDSIEITVLSASPEETARVHGVGALPRMSPSGVMRALRECDLLVSGGGSLIQDVTSFASLAYYLGVIELAKLHPRKVMVLGQGIGPLRRTLSRRSASLVLNKIDLITVRDAQSAELLGDLGVCRPPILVTADPTFTLAPCQPEEAVRLLSGLGLGPDDDLVAVSLRRWPESPEIERSAAEALSVLAEKLPARILLVTMHTPEDTVLARQVQEAVHSAKVLVQPEPWTPPQLLGVLGCCRLVVGMRLHALIFAAAAGVPCAGISYDPKVEHFLAAVGQASMGLTDLTSDLLVEHVAHAWESRDTLASRLRTAVPPMRQAASENIRLALELLGLS